MKNRHILLLQWLLCSMLTVLFSACSSSDAAEGPKEATHQQPQLAIYVYAPEQAAAKRNAAQTRADVGEVDAIIDEGTIDSLQIWIYESATGNYVGYFSTKDVTALNEGQGTTYQIPVTDAFAAAKPNVDVYVMANVTNANCGVETGTLNKETTRAALLEGAKINAGHFGLEQKTRTVPDDGLPFAGKLTTQPVVGDAPTLRVGTLSAVSTVQLTRAVSKLRFVFSKTTGQPEVKITSITMNANMIPNVEYLFQTPTSMTYNTEAKQLLLDDIDDIAETADPTQYLYLGQDAQEYENLINAAANKQPNPEVTVEGPIYLRESDKQLAGTITYTIAGGDEQTADFAMQQAGDFSRNHTWIVYAYYGGSGNLQVQSIYVKDWSTKEMNHDLYNW